MVSPGQSRKRILIRSASLVTMLIHHGADPVSQVLAVVQYFQNRDAPENQEEELWSKMRNAGPAHPAEELSDSRDMSREGSGSQEALGRPEQFANPVSFDYPFCDRQTDSRSASRSSTAYESG
jgi:hypothetical protein